MSGGLISPKRTDLMAVVTVSYYFQLSVNLSLNFLLRGVKLMRVLCTTLADSFSATTAVTVKRHSE